MGEICSVRPSDASTWRSLPQRCALLSVATDRPHGARYTRRVELELSPSVMEQLNERAKSLGIRPEELARAAVTDLVSRPAEDFESAAEHILKKNAELYRRLG